METARIIEAIEKIANPAWQAGWDKSGLQVANTRGEATTLGVFLDPLPSMVARALDAGADFLLCHHPLSLKPGLPSRLNDYHAVLAMLFRANVPLYAAHTSLDVNLAGPAGWLGRELGLGATTPLESLEGKYLGYGEAGELPEPMAFGKLVNLVLRLAKVECGNLAGPARTGMCNRVAYCGGSGGSLLEAAAACGADLYITGDIRYHTALAAEIPVLDVGHHSLEEEMMRRFALLLDETLTDLHIHFFPSLSPFKRACQ